MGFKPKSDVSSYIEKLTPEDLKEAFEEYGFEVELKKDVESNEKNKERKCGERI